MPNTTYWIYTKNIHLVIVKKDEFAYNLYSLFYFYLKVEICKNFKNYYNILERVLHDWEFISVVYNMNICYSIMYTSKYIVRQ